jgi:diketogulonate reductase-like aldo/keto reductase
VYKNEAIQAIATAHSMPVSSVVLHWALARDVVVLPRSTNAEHIATNGQLATFDGPVPLTTEELAVLDALDAPRDQNDSCAKWASEGECGANPAFMWETCVESCQRQDHPAVDAV